MAHTSSTASKIGIRTLAALRFSGRRGCGTGAGAGQLGAGGGAFTTGGAAAANVGDGMTRVGGVEAPASGVVPQPA
ncbi:hypothetical protein H7H51_14335 [Mycolicibacterium farcinogenes]|nr:hypothetical protein [Mycolicibacterium farcinogenes]